MPLQQSSAWLEIGDSSLESVTVVSGTELSVSALEAFVLVA